MLTAFLLPLSFALVASDVAPIIEQLPVVNATGHDAAPPAVATIKMVNSRAEFDALTIKPADWPVSIWEHDNFNGRGLLIGEGYLNNLGNDWNDVITSFRVSAGYEFHGWEHADRNGYEGIWYRDTANVGDWWNDKISSIWVRRV